MGEFKLSGGCQCGTVRYTIYEPARSTDHCHCSMCRKIHGALFASFSQVSEDKFTVDRGKENLVNFDSSPQVHRKFCKTCGCQIYIAEDQCPGLILFTAATLDGGAHPGHPEDAVKHIWVGSKVTWYNIANDSPQHDES